MRLMFQDEARFGPYQPKNGSSSRRKTENSSIDAGLRPISMTAEQFLLGDSFKFHNVF